MPVCCRNNFPFPLIKQTEKVKTVKNMPHPIRIRHKRHRFMGKHLA